MSQNPEEAIKNIETAIEKITNKEQIIIFLVPDTKGNARASVAHTYRQAMTLKNAGYNVGILTEKRDYIKPGSWLGLEYEQLNHYSIEENNLKVGPQDFIVIPEIFGTIAEQIEKMPLEKIMSVQSHEFLLEPYAPGKSFVDYGIDECITTSETMANMIKEMLMLINVPVINLGIPDYFSPSDKPQKPIVAIHTRESRKAAKIIKTFYLKYPLYKFISFKDMHGLTERDFASALKECCVSVWVDPETSFGTFPIESIKCDVPVIGKVPDVILDWMTDENGIWIQDENQIVDVLANFIKNWLDDTIPDTYKNISKTMEGKFTTKESEEQTLKVYQDYFERRLNKLEGIKQNYLIKEEETND